MGIAMIKKRGKDIAGDTAPGKKSASGADALSGSAGPERRGGTGFRERGRDAILGLIAACKRMMGPWDSAKRLFDYRDADVVLGKALADADLRLAIDIFVISGSITFIMSLIAILGSAYVTNAELDMIRDATQVMQPGLETGTLVAPIILSFVIYLPASILLSLVLEYCAFRVLRRIGGKATFPEQLYLSSMVALAAAFVSGLYIFFPIPCLQLVAMACLVIVNTYLGLVVGGKAYSIAHRIGWVPGFLTALVLGALKLVIIFFLINAIAPMLGLPPQLTILSDALKGA